MTDFDQKVSSVHKMQEEFHEEVTLSRTAYCTTKLKDMAGFAITKDYLDLYFPLESKEKVRKCFEINY